MRFHKTNKNFMFLGDDETEIIDFLDQNLVNVELMPRSVEKYYGSIVSNFYRNGHLTKDQYNRLVDIYRDYCEHDEDISETF